MGSNPIGGFCHFLHWLGIVQSGACDRSPKQRMMLHADTSSRRWWVGLVLGRGFNPRGMETCRGSIPPSPRYSHVRFEDHASNITRVISPPNIMATLTSPDSRRQAKHMTFTPTLSRLWRTSPTKAKITICKTLPAGLEPATLRLTASRSNQLSYEGDVKHIAINQLQTAAGNSKTQLCMILSMRGTC